MGLLTTTVGSFPKPVRLRAARWRYAEGEIDGAALREVEVEAVREVIRLQESIGLELLVDGQMERGDMVSFFAEQLDGVEPGGLVRCFGNRYYRRPRIVGPIVRTGPLTIAGWAVAREAARRPVKAVLTGPYTLMDWSFDEYYSFREDCCLAFAEVIRTEAAELLAAGAKEIQFDEPALSARPDEMAFVARALSRVADDLHGKARTWLHIAYGDLAPVLPEILALPVDGFLLEMANSGFGLLDKLSEMPSDKILAAGVVDVTRPETESTDEIARRIEILAARVPPSRLWITPDAGLRALTAGQARAKLEAMVAAAARFG